MRVKDIVIGKKYHNLLVLEDLGGLRHCHRFLVKCLKCGKKFDISPYSIGKTTACASCSQMKTDKDITGCRFGKLTVLGYDHTKYFRKGHPHTMWRCHCDCGKDIIVDKTALVRNTPQQSCGCGKKTILREKNTTHGMSKSRLYNVWNGMRERCSNPNNSSYEDYGGRGVKVCAEWHVYENFHKWAMDNGYDPDAPYGEKTIDRIDVDGNYEPSNCRWVDSIAQANNRRNKSIIYRGDKISIADFCRIMGFSRVTVNRHLKKGIDINHTIYLLTNKVKWNPKDGHINWNRTVKD